MTEGGSVKKGNEEVEARVDVVVEELNEVEETLIFRLRAT